MAESFRVDSHELQVLARRMKAAGDGSLHREVVTGIRGAAKRLIPVVRQGAKDRLPRGGGLAARVAGQRFSVHAWVTAGKVFVVGEGMKELGIIDSGTVRHPVFGRRGAWVRQSVTPGFFTASIEAHLSEVRGDVETVVRTAAKNLERPL